MKTIVEVTKSRLLVNVPIAHVWYTQRRGNALILHLLPIEIDLGEHPHAAAILSRFAPLRDLPDPDVISATDGEPGNLTTKHTEA